MKCAIGLVALSLASAASAEPLWQNVEMGMTVAQLTAARPGAHEIPADQKKHYLGDCSYVDAQTTINTIPMDVCFTVVEGKVTGVALHSDSLKVPALGEGVKDLLAGKYGAPVFDQCGTGVVATCTTTWRKGALRIEAKQTTVLGDTYLTIRYQGFASDDAAKL